MSVALPAPVRLSAAVEAVVEAHPYSAHGKIEPSARLDKDADELWRRLTALDERSLSAAVDSLHTIEVRILLATARPRLHRPDVARVLAMLLARRDPPGATALAWVAYLITNGHPALRALAATHARDKSPVHRDWPAIVADAGPVRAALSMYHRQPEPFARWIARPRTALDQVPEFLRQVQRALLVPGGLALLDRRESSADIDAWVLSAVPAGEREDWYLAFLEETAANRRPAGHVVLHTVLDRFGEPTSGRPFWDRLSEGARAAFQLWLMDRRLTQLLGEGERVEFWRRFLPHIKRVFPNRDRQVVFVSLGGIVAVQFVNWGTATYIFRDAIFSRIDRGSESEVRRSVYRYTGSSAGSYEHRGSTWHSSAESVVRRLLKEVDRG